MPRNEWPKQTSGWRRMLADAPVRQQKTTISGRLASQFLAANAVLLDK